jgi:CheY-like chemotaxis protein
MDARPASVLLIENEGPWRRLLEDALRGSGVGDVKTIESFSEAERVLAKIDLYQFAFAVLDVRMRKHLFDQGGLYLLDLLKSRRPLLPVLMVSAYFSDYPALKAQTDRYKKVLVREKEEFLRSAGEVVALLNGPTSCDTFLSYRHQEPDRGFTRDLQRELEACGYRVAIDERDFAGNESFPSEMERWIRASRFTLAIISPRYLESGNAQEEAVICKVLDMSERRRRLVPVIIEKTPLPAWLYNIVGVDFTASDPLVSPMDRLKKTLGDPW